MASGLPLVSSRKDRGQTVFCFTETDKLLQLVQGYFNMTSTVVPLQYGSALKILKNIVYQDRHNNHYDDNRIYNDTRKGN
ncbi:MAG: DUF5659 domain-containing protein [Bacteroidota bacterium]